MISLFKNFRFRWNAVKEEIVFTVLGVAGICCEKVRLNKIVTRDPQPFYIFLSVSRQLSTGLYKVKGNFGEVCVQLKISLCGWLSVSTDVYGVDLSVSLLFGAILLKDHLESSLVAKTSTIPCYLNEHSVFTTLTKQTSRKQLPKALP